MRVRSAVLSALLLAAAGLARACPADELDLGELEGKIDNGVQQGGQVGTIIDTGGHLDHGNSAGAEQALADAAQSEDPFIKAAAHNELSRAFLQMNQPGRALQAAQTSAQLYPKYGEAYSNIAAAKMTMGDIAGAQKFAERGASIWPDNGLSKKMSQGIQAYASAPAGPAQSAALASMGLFGGPENAAAQVGAKARVAGLNSGADIAGQLRSRGDENLSKATPVADAQNRLRLGDYEGAKASAGRALLENPDDGMAHAVLANANNLSGDYDAAIDEATKALEAGANIEALNARSFAYNAQGSPKSALMDAEMAVKLAPRDPLAYLNRAQALESLGKVEPAMQDYKRAAKLNPAFKKLFEKAYARNAGALGEGAEGPRGFGGTLKANKGKVGLGVLGLGGALAAAMLLGGGAPKPRAEVTTGVLKALGVSTTSRKITTNGSRHSTPRAPGERRRPE